MSDKDDGGAAFPASIFVDVQGDVYTRESALSLRDYFAAKFLQGFVAGMDENYEHVTREEAAKLAYLMADAMLEARKK